MFKIIVKDDDGYEDNFYSKDCVIEIHGDTNIHSYVNGFITALKAEGFLVSTIKAGLEEGVTTMEEELDVYSSN